MSILREKMDAPDAILDEITRKQLSWYGHVVRMDPTRLPKIMINWKPEGREKRGRPRRSWKDAIYSYTAMSERYLRMGEWNNRRQWNMEVGRLEDVTDMSSRHVGDETATNAAQQPKKTTNSQASCFGTKRVHLQWYRSGFVIRDLWYKTTQKYVNPGIYIARERKKILPWRGKQ